MQYMLLSKVGMGGCLSKNSFAKPHRTFTILCSCRRGCFKQYSFLTTVSLWSFIHRLYKDLEQSQQAFFPSSYSSEPPGRCFRYQLIQRLMKWRSIYWGLGIYFLIQMEEKALKCLSQSQLNGGGREKEQDQTKPKAIATVVKTIHSKRASPHWITDTVHRLVHGFYFAGRTSRFSLGVPPLKPKFYRSVTGQPLPPCCPFSGSQFCCSVFLYVQASSCPGLKLVSISLGNS